MKKFFAIIITMMTLGLAIDAASPGALSYENHDGE
jgi:hypothetical protein